MSRPLSHGGIVPTSNIHYITTIALNYGVKKYTFVIMQISQYPESFPLQAEGAPRLSCKAAVGSNSEREQRRNGQRDSWWKGLHM